MKNDLFQNDQEIIAECDKLVHDDSLDAEDRITIGSFYNGRDTMSQADAEAQGITQVTNHLFGYDSLNLARIQIEGIFTKPKHVWGFKLYDAPMEMRQQWEMSTTEHFNAVIKESKRLKPQVKSLGGQATLYGSAHLMWRDTLDWCPRTARPLVPFGTGILATDIPYACVPSHLTLGELIKFREGAKKLTEQGLKSDWKMDSLDKAIDTLRSNVSDGSVPSYGIGNQQQTMDELEQARQEQGAAAQGYRMKVPVYFFYVARPDEEGTPFDLIILARWTPAQRDRATKQKMILPVVMYECERKYENAHQWLNPYFIDTSIGGEPSWHRVMGLGALNYEADVDTEQFFNTAMQGSLENLRRTFRVESQADWELIAKWNQGQTPSNVLPPGLKSDEAVKNPNFQYAFTTMQMLQGLSRRNASSAIGNTGDSSSNELEIQALERQGRNAEALAARMSDIYDATDALGLEMFRRMLQPVPMASDPGYEEIVAFQKRLRKDGVSVDLLRKWMKNNEGQVCVETSRATGDGDRVRMVMVNQMLMNRLHLFNPQAQQIILKRVTAQETQDYKLAEELVPYEKKADANQVERANNENQACILRAITGYVPERNPDDLDMEHVPEHFGGMQGLLAIGQAKGWTQIELAAFKALGSHAAMHIQAVKAIKEQADVANQMMHTLEGIAKQGQEFANNLEQSEQDEAKQKELELKERNQMLKERGQVALEQHRAAALDLSKRKQASKEVIEAQRLADQENDGAHRRMMTEVEMVEGKKDKIIERAEERSQAADERAAAKA
jgi:hypothetical protein